jgi:hypothetical protein
LSHGCHLYVRNRIYSDCRTPEYIAYCKYEFAGELAF